MVRHAQAVTAYLKSIGSKGGKIGGKTTGKSKLRGDSAHYQKLSKLAAKARKKR